MGLQFESASEHTSFKGRRRQSVYDIITRRVSLATPSKGDTPDSVAPLDSAADDRSNQHQTGSELGPPAATVGALERVREQLEQERKAHVKRLLQKLSKVVSADEAQAEKEGEAADSSRLAVSRLRSLVNAEVAKRVERGELPAWPPAVGDASKFSTSPSAADPPAGPVPVGQEQIDFIDKGISRGRRRSSMALQLDMFRKADTDNNGTLDFDEFAGMECHRGLSRDQVRAAFARLDTDGDNALTLDEFAKYRVRNLLKLDQYREEEKRKQQEAVKADDDRHDDVVRLTEDTIARYSFAAGASHNRF